MAAISQTIFSDTFLWIKILYFDKEKSQKFVPKRQIGNNPAVFKIIS